MASMTINIPDSLLAELNTISEHLHQTPEQCLQLALCHFLQTQTLDNALEGMERMKEEVAFIDFPELKEAYEIDIKFHPMAIEELDSLEEEDQMSLLEDLIERISEENGEENDNLDLVLKEEGETQIILSEFPFGDVVYKIDNAVTVYHIALAEEMMDAEDEEEEEESEGRPVLQ